MSVSYVLDIEQAASGEARDAHWVRNPVTGLYERSLLVEPQRTNDFLRSESFDNAAWVKSAASVSSDATTAPDGASTADTLFEDTSTGLHYTYQQISDTNITANADYVFSCFAKAAGRSWLRLSVRRISGVTVPGEAFFNLSSGTIGTFDTDDAWIEGWGDGWYRIAVLFNQGSGIQAFRGFITLAEADGDYSYTGDGSSGVHLFGAQLEEGSYPTSYIPTTTASVTRSADNAQLETLPSTTFTSASTYYARGVYLGTASTSLTELLRVSASNPRIKISVDAANNRAQAEYLGTNSITRQPTVADIAHGDLVEVRVVLKASGGNITLNAGLAVNEGSESTAGESSVADGGDSAFGDNQLTIEPNVAFALTHEAWDDGGEKTLVQMRTLAGV